MMRKKLAKIVEAKSMYGNMVSEFEIGAGGGNENNM